MLVHRGCTPSPVDVSRGILRETLEVSSGVRRIDRILAHFHCVKASSQGGSVDLVSNFYLASAL